MAINFISNYDNSYKSIYNQQLSNKLASTTARLSEELDILRNRDIDLAVKNLTATTKTPQNTEESATSLQSDFISQSIKDILDIRKSLGITEAAGNNIPLEELFQTYKTGEIIDTQS